MLSNVITFEVTSNVGNKCVTFVVLYVINITFENIIICYFIKALDNVLLVAMIIKNIITI